MFKTLPILLSVIAVIISGMSLYISRDSLRFQKKQAVDLYNIEVTGVPIDGGNALKISAVSSIPIVMGSKTFITSLVVSEGKPKRVDMGAGDNEILLENILELITQNIEGARDKIVLPDGGFIDDLKIIINDYTPIILSVRFRARGKSYTHTAIYAVTYNAEFEYKGVEKSVILTGLEYCNGVELRPVRDFFSGEAVMLDIRYIPKVKITNPRVAMFICDIQTPSETYVDGEQVQ